MKITSKRMLGLPLVPGLTAILIAGCGQPVAATDHADNSGASDTSCNVVLRTVNVVTDASGQPVTNCASGTCYTELSVVFDVGTDEVYGGAAAYVLWMGQDTSGSDQALAQPVSGGQVGFIRFQATLSTHTFSPGNQTQVVQLIPYLSTSSQDLYDHNVNADASANYQLTSANGWSLTTPSSVCIGNLTPKAIGTLTFPVNGQVAQTGTIAQLGKLNLEYDLTRLQASLSCANGASSATAFVMVQPENATVQEQVAGPIAFTSGSPVNYLFEFDLPLDATSVAIWFEGNSSCTGSQWDSNQGQNFVYSVTAESLCTADGQPARDMTGGADCCAENGIDAAGDCNPANSSGCTNAYQPSTNQGADCCGMNGLTATGLCEPNGCIADGRQASGADTAPLCCSVSGVDSNGNCLPGACTPNGQPPRVSSPGGEVNIATCCSQNGVDQNGNCQAT